MSHNLEPLSATFPEEMSLNGSPTPGDGPADGKDAAPMLRGPKRQHFLPRFYLDGFTRDGLLAVYDRDRNQIRRQQPINTAVIGHLYTMLDGEGRQRFELEAFLAECEGKAKPAIEKLCGKATELSADERSDLAIFIALAATRTPDMVNSIQSLNGEMIKHMAKVMFSDVDDVVRQLREDGRNEHASDEALREQAQIMVQLASGDHLTVETDEKWAVGRAIEMALAAAPYLAGRHWRVVHRANETMSFVTADAPVYLGTVRLKPSPYAVGLGSPDAFISFPLHQSCVLEMFGQTGLLEHRVAGRSYMRMANRHFAKRCQRFVVGRDEAHLASLARQTGLAASEWKPKFRMN